MSAKIIRSSLVTLLCKSRSLEQVGEPRIVPQAVVLISGSNVPKERIAIYKAPFKQRKCPVPVAKR
ncbi:MAG: hypothetical protein AB7Q37_12575 [Pyrinomonadaceae bacterium]